MALLAPISHGFLEDDGGAPGLYVTEAGVVVIRSTQGGPLVPVGGGGSATGVPEIHSTGVLDFGGSAYPGPGELFASALVGDAILVKAWAVFDFFNLTFTGTTCQFQLWLAHSGDADGTLIAQYDLSIEQPNSYGTPPWLAEPNALDTASTDVFANAQRALTLPTGESGVIFGYSQGDGLPVSGDYEVHALVIAP